MAAGQAPSTEKNRGHPAIAVHRVGIRQRGGGAGGPAARNVGGGTSDLPRTREKRPTELGPPVTSGSPAFLLELTYAGVEVDPLDGAYKRREHNLDLMHLVAEGLVLPYQ